MQYGLVVVPPSGLAERIRAFQDTHLAAPPLAEPHITVKAPGGLGADEAWLDGVRSTAAHFPAFRTGIGSVAMFGTDILYLRVEPCEALVRLHAALLAVVNPSPALIERHFEGPAYVAHLTLAGPGIPALQAIKAAAEKTFTEHETFDVRFLRVLRQAEPGGPYRPYRDLPLA